MDRPRPLQELSHADAPAVGGKAAALGELMRAGFRVPDGFVVPAKFPSPSKGEGQGEVCGWDPVIAAFRRLGSSLVAVRSSAAVEDGASASWAGQFETELNVGENGLVESIRRCRESGRSKRAKAYGGETATIHVLVQAMVPADVAGVAFSINPVTGENVVTIEAVHGLGEALVSGRVSPDPDAVGEEETKEIVETVRRIESHFGYHVDVEWAIADRTLYILQARPITTF